MSVRTKELKNSEEFDVDPDGLSVVFTSGKPLGITWAMARLLLRLFPPCALVSHAQGSSGVVD